MSLRAIGFSLAAMGLFCLSCASLPPATELTFFVPAPEDDPWAQKIGNWQARHELDPIRQGEPPRKSSELAQEYDQFSREMRRQIAAETAAWVQARSRSYYQPDGDRDHWATFGEVVETGRDDCDGLDMLTFQLLRRMGFGAEEIFRAIVVERPTGQHHMVTLWFEDGDRTDPFVLDPTGVVTTEMVRLSEIGSWEPIEIFDETAHYRVEPAPGPASVAGK
jgi:transglutaminase-like putative cysteine protease